MSSSCSSSSSLRSSTDRNRQVPHGLVGSSTISDEGLAVRISVMPRGDHKDEGLRRLQPRARWSELDYNTSTRGLLLRGYTGSEITELPTWPQSSWRHGVSEYPSCPFLCPFFSKFQQNRGIELHASIQVYCTTSSEVEKANGQFFGGELAGTQCTWTENMLKSQRHSLCRENEVGGHMHCLGNFGETHATKKKTVSDWYTGLSALTETGVRNIYVGNAPFLMVFIINTLSMGQTTLSIKPRWHIPTNDVQKKNFDFFQALSMLDCSSSETVKL